MEIVLGDVGSPGFEGDPEVPETGVDPLPQPARVIQQSRGSSPQGPWIFIIRIIIASSQAVPGMFGVPVRRQRVSVVWIWSNGGEKVCN